MSWILSLDMEERLSIMMLFDKRFLRNMICSQMPFHTFIDFVAGDASVPQKMEVMKHLKECATCKKNFEDYLYDSALLDKRVKCETQEPIWDDDQVFLKNLRKRIRDKVSYKPQY